MTTETAPEELVSAIADAFGPTAEHADAEAIARDTLALEEPPEAKIPRFGDPRKAVVDVVRERLDRALQPVEDDDVWHGVAVITRKDLNEVLALDLPPASIFAASVRTPSFIYVDAICPVCGIAGEITLEVGVKLIAVQSSRKLQLTAKASALPHQCGQLRIKDVSPTSPVAAGQTTAFDREGADPPDAEDEAWMNAPMGTPVDVVEPVDEASDDGTTSQDDDVDLRPTGEVNADELRGAIDRDSLDDIPF